MIVVIFEVLPADGRKADYLERAKRLKASFSASTASSPSSGSKVSPIPISYCRYPYGETNKRWSAGAVTWRIVQRSRPAAQASSRLSFDGRGCHSRPAQSADVHLASRGAKAVVRAEIAAVAGRMARAGDYWPRALRPSGRRDLGRQGAKPVPARWRSQQGRSWPSTRS